MLCSRPLPGKAATSDRSLVAWVGTLPSVVLLALLLLTAPAPAQDTSMVPVTLGRHPKPASRRHLKTGQ
jgi:hypothetical protein